MKLVIELSDYGEKSVQEAIAKYQRIQSGSIKLCGFKLFHNDENSEAANAIVNICEQWIAGLESKS